MNDKNKINELNAINFTKYENIGLDYLVMYTIGQLSDMKIDLSFENIVVAAYKLFPKKFSLTGYPEYPASKRIHDAIFHCTYKSKKWLNGKTAMGFMVTERSTAIINKATSMIEGRMITVSKLAHSKSRRKEKILHQILSTIAYKKYSKDQISEVSESEICYLLQGTLDTPKEVLINNLSILKTYAKEVEDKHIIKFLKDIEHHYRSI